ncbi:MAG TPA: hypothetical protein PLY68_00850 [Myxococcota bacterium]|nr:hypothetical protein [Myxococcota bacterium]HPB49726.1 hypothetical protein [Myxococcota bacterium]HQP94726.1 hypothetical protein [Myxococcota bacterium]
MNKHEVEALAADLLAGVIPGFQAVSGNQPMARKAELLADINGRRVVIAVKAVRTSVVEDVVGRLAIASLQAGHSAGGTQNTSLAVVIVPSVGRKTVAAAQSFMSTYMPSAAWAVMDRAGNARVSIPALAVDIDRSFARVERTQAGRTSISLFSDLNRWLLKILLLVDAPEDLWGGPRQTVLSNPELVRVAGVSPEMVRRFVTAFQDRDLLRQTPEGLRLVRRSTLLDLWRADEALTARQAVPVRRLIAGTGSVPDLVSIPGFADLTVVAGFEACRHLGLLHTFAPHQTEVYVNIPVSEAMRRFGLEECSPSDADIWLIPTRRSRSILGGRLSVEGIPVVDAFQASLDVLRHPGRGREQSDYIIHEVLKLGDDD